MKMVEQMAGDSYQTLNEYYQEYRPEDIKRTLEEKWENDAR